MLDQFAENISVAENPNHRRSINNGQSSYAHHTHQTMAVVNGLPYKLDSLFFLVKNKCNFPLYIVLDYKGISTHDHCRP